jgi:2TM domain
MEKNAMENQEAYLIAKKKVEARIGFYLHLAAYVVVNILLIIINLSTSTQYLWFKWPLIGWGIGVFFHALGTFVFSGGSVIKERMIEREMKKEALKKH